MMACCGTRRTPPRCQESPFASWSLVGIPLVALVLLLPTLTDACVDPLRYESMKVKGVPQNSYSPGDQIEYECRPGYMRLVPLVITTAVCQPDNTWTPLQEACTKRSCPQLAEPTNGHMSGNFLFGSRVTFVCNEGFYLFGTDSVYCDLLDDSVGWDKEPPSCERILCKPPAQIPNGKYTNTHKDSFEYNEVVTYSCIPSNGPDEYSLVGESKLICSGHDSWSSEPPECKVVKCPYPALKNGRQVSGFRKKYYYKAMVVLECVEGFYLKGNDTIVCGANNFWEPEMPECIKVPTPPSTKPPIPSNTNPPTSSHSVTTPPSTKSPTSSAPDVKPPALPTTPPDSGSPAHPTSSAVPPSRDLGAGVIVGIVAGSLVAAAGLGLIAYIYLKRNKKREGEISASYSPCQDKPATPAEQIH